MSRRKMRSAADARACLEAAEASGLGRRAWAAANGIDARSLNAWRLNLARGGRIAMPRPSLVELVPVGEVPEARPDPQYRVSYGPLTVEVDAAFDEAVLRRLLAVVMSC